MPLPSTDTARPALAERLRRRHPALLALLLAALIAPVLIWTAGTWAQHWAQSRAEAVIATAAAAAQARAMGASNGLTRELVQLHTLSQLIAGDERIVASLGQGAGAAVANEQLQRMAELKLADLIWLLDPSGLCVAASNFSQPESLVGTRYADRTYFQQALAGGLGQQYAVGRRTRVPGLFFAAPVRDRTGAVVGVLAVKTDLPPLVARLALHDALVVDDWGVVVLSSRAELLYAAVPGASALKQSAAALLARYQREALRPLPWVEGGWPGQPELAVLDGQPLLVRELSTPDSVFSLRLLEPLPALVDLPADERKLALILSLAGLLLVWALAFAGLAWHRAQSLQRELRASNLELARLNESLALEASTDVLTGCLNRRHFLRRCEAELERSRRHAHPLVLVLIDLDRFKAINDQHGHAMGDAVLQRVAQCLQSSVRKIDLVARLGGDEFGLLLLDLPDPLAQALLQRLCDFVARPSARPTAARCT
jgi:diguanylate cyclase